MNFLDCPYLRVCLLAACLLASYPVSLKAEEVRIVSPLDGQTVNGKILIEAAIEHSDSTGHIDFYFQGPGAKDRYGWKDYSPPYSWGGENQNLDTTLFPDGEASVVAFYHANSTHEVTAEDRTNFIIDNGKPVINIVKPKDGEKVTGTLSVDVDAIDNSGVNNPAGIASLLVYLDGTLKGTSSSEPYSFLLNICLLSEGPHSLRVVAVDNDGYSSAKSIVIFVNNSALISTVRKP